MVPAGLCAYRDLRRKRARKWGDTVTQPDDPRRVGVIVELIDHTIAIAKLNERGDLVQRLTRARQRITDPQVRVVIAGLLKQGKSQLLNSLLNLPAARVGDDEATVVITGAQQKQISAVATVAAAASVSTSADRAVVLLFVNQTITVGKDAPTTAASSVRVTLDNINGRWLISQFEPI